jgi:hypothetical protein
MIWSATLKWFTFLQSTFVYILSSEIYWISISTPKIKRLKLRGLNLLLCWWRDEVRTPDSYFKASYSYLVENEKQKWTLNAGNIENSIVKRRLWQRFLMVQSWEKLQVIFFKLIYNLKIQISWLTLLDSIIRVAFNFSWEKSLCEETLKLWWTNFNS